MDPRLSEATVMERPERPVIRVDELLYLVLRHKGKLLLCALAGVLAAAVVVAMSERVFGSSARLVVRYVVDTQVVHPADSERKARSPDDRGQNILNTEMEILTSRDLLEQVVDVIGARVILGDDRVEAGGWRGRVRGLWMGIRRRVMGPEDPSPTMLRRRAAARLAAGLRVESPRKSNVLQVSMRHSNPRVPQVALEELTRRYLEKHHEIHRSGTALNKFLSEEVAVSRAQLHQVQTELERLNARVGLLNVEDSRRELTEQWSRIRQALHEAEAELAGDTAALKSLRPVVPRGGAGEPGVEPPGGEGVRRPVELEYQLALDRLRTLRGRELELMGQVTGVHPLAMAVRGQIEEARRSIERLEQEHPGLGTARVTSPGVSEGSGWRNGRGWGDPVEAESRVRALAAKVGALQVQLTNVQSELARVVAVEPEYGELKRRREQQEANYRYLRSSYEKARIEEEMDISKLANIAFAQNPSMPAPDRSPATRLALLFVAAGVGCGIGLALLFEYPMNTGFQRAADVNSVLRIPTFLSIPRLPGMSRGSGNGGAGRWERGGGWEEYLEALRDRVVMHFEGRNIQHKPKLVGLTGTEAGAGVSTLAAGLAATLSETGDGRVLLVDLNEDRGSLSPFFGGHAACSLSEALLEEKRVGGRLQENLYLAVPGQEDGKKTAVRSKQFAELMPKLRACDFDYIIFDLPPAHPTSPTIRIAGMMDVVLLVLAAERTSRRVAMQSMELLSGAKAAVAGVLNRTTVR